MFSRRGVLWRIVVIKLSLAELYLGGWGIDRLELDIWPDRTFFHLRFECLAECPFWFLAGLVVLMANGVFLLRWGNLEGAIQVPHEGWIGKTGGYELNVPLPTLKMLSLNLLLLPIIWFAYILLASI